MSDTNPFAAPESTFDQVVTTRWQTAGATHEEGVSLGGDERATSLSLGDMRERVAALRADRTRSTELFGTGYVAPGAPQEAADEESAPAAPDEASEASQVAPDEE